MTETPEASSQESSSVGASSRVSPATGTLIERFATRVLHHFGRTRDDVGPPLYGMDALPPDTGIWRARYVLPVLFVLGIAIALLRLPNGGLGTLWAEDASIFLQGAASPNPALAFITPYAGYLHIVPRTVAALITAVVPLPDVAIAFTIVAAAIASALGCFVFQLSRSRIRLPFLSALIWISWTTMSMTEGEVLANLANLHWYFTAAAVWALLTRHRSQAMRVIATLVILFAILSDGLSLVLIPLFILRYVFLAEPGRRRLAWLATAAYLIQLVAICVAPFIETRVSPYHEAPSVPYLLIQYIDRVVLVGVGGVRFSTTLTDWSEHIWIVPAVIFVALLVLVIIRSRVRVIALAFALYSLVLFLACWVTVGGGYPYNAFYYQGRYAVVPIMLLVAGAALVVDSWLASPRYRRAYIPLFAVSTVLMLAVFTYDFQFWSQRATSVPFAQSVSAAAHRCVGEPAARDVKIDVSPNEKWSVTLTCGQLLNGLR